MVKSNDSLTVIALDWIELKLFTISFGNLFMTSTFPLNSRGFCL